jgi:hypothetical protein
VSASSLIDAVASASFTERVARFAPNTRDEPRPPLHWPSMTCDEATREWPELLDWVQGLRGRYEVFDEKILPPCWYQHPCYVGALQALRDFERVAYAKTAPGSAGVDWHRALRDIEALITRWSAGPVACVGGHKVTKKMSSVDNDAFGEFLTQDLTKRRNERPLR